MKNIKYNTGSDIDKEQWKKRQSPEIHTIHTRSWHKIKVASQIKDEQPNKWC